MFQALVRGEERLLHNLGHLGVRQPQAQKQGVDLVAIYFYQLLKGRHFATLRSAQEGALCGLLLSLSYSHWVVKTIMGVAGGSGEPVSKFFLVQPCAGESGSQSSGR